MELAEQFRGLGWMANRIRTAQPRPMNGIFVAIRVMNCTFASGDSLAQATTDLLFAFPTNVSNLLHRRTVLKWAGSLPLAASLAGETLPGTGLLASALAAATSPDREAATVDGHVHVWKCHPRYPWAPETTNPPEGDATPEKLLDLMKGAGVQRTVIIQVIYYRWDNRYLASVLKRYPQTFRGVARVNPEDPAAPDHLSKLTEEDGFHGVRISPEAGASGDWIRGPLMPALWRRCRDLGVPMTVLAPVGRMPDVAKLAARFPDLTVVIDHMASCPLHQPSELEKLLALRHFPKVYVKISHSWTLSSQAYPYLDSQEQIRQLYDAFGPRRLIAATDWPLVEKYCSYSHAIDLARSRIGFLNAEDKRWICARTAEKVWPFRPV